MAKDQIPSKTIEMQRRFKGDTNVGDSSITFSLDHVLLQETGVLRSVVMEQSVQERTIPPHQGPLIPSCKENLEAFLSSRLKDQLEGSESRFIDSPLKGGESRVSKVELGVEALFEGVAVPNWQDQLTFRSLVVGTFLGVLFSIITHKLALTVGIIPSFNIAAGLLGFFVMKSWSGMLTKAGLLSKPFTRQENTIIQTCVVACSDLAFSGGFSTYLLAMDQQSYENLKGQTGNHLEDVYAPSLSRIIPYLLVISLGGVVALVPLRKILVIEYELTYHTGTATGVLINSFHTPQGAAEAKKQVNCLAKYFTISFLWSLFKWFFSGVGNTCGFDNFPSLGLKAFENRFYFNFALPYVGIGMICPHIVSWSVLLGGIISWGIMWPLVENQAGNWFPKNLQSYDFEGINGYRVFVSIALILGDGLYNAAKITYISLKSVYLQHKKAHQLPSVGRASEISQALVSADEKKRTEYFLRDQIPTWAAVSSYVGLAVIATAMVPQIFSEVKWYYVLISYCIAPILAFCNAYGAGVTDWSMVTTYGKVGLFIFASWAGSHGGIIAGLGTAGVMMTIVLAASDLMQDFKTGYLTLSSARSMFISQLVGTLLGCLIAPLTFWLFWTAFQIGKPDGEYKAPNATIFRAMAIIGTQGFSFLPKHCLQICYGFFVGAIVVNIARDMTPRQYARFIPIPIAMALPFYLGTYFAMDMVVGSMILFIWQKRNPQEADTFATVVASGLICGDGLWTVPSAILALVDMNPPICISFLPT